QSGVARLGALVVFGALVGCGEGDDARDVEDREGFFDRFPAARELMAARAAPAEPGGWGSCFRRVLVRPARARSRRSCSPKRRRSRSSVAPYPSRASQTGANPPLPSISTR